MQQQSGHHSKARWPARHTGAVSSRVGGHPDGRACLERAALRDLSPLFPGRASCNSRSVRCAPVSPWDIEPCDRYYVPGPRS